MAGVDSIHSIYLSLRGHLARAVLVCAVSTYGSDLVLV